MSSSGVSGAPGNRVSLLRASVPARLGMVTVAVSLLWLGVFWALT